jgi:predicted TIM-barrel fold metal-dependent hydrolase
MTRRSLLLQAAAAGGIGLREYEPKSTLRVAEHPVAKAKFPVIDVHTHLFGLGRKTGPQDLAQIARWMDECNLGTLLNLTGGTSETIPGILKMMAPFGRKFLTGAEPVWARAHEPGYAQWQAAELEKCKQQGARALKILKTLGLYLRENGKLVKIDDPRFDPMWDAAGALGMPVLIHTSDPAAFFQPIDRFNERYEELQNHPDWSFYGKDYPPKRELLEARNRVVAKHPKTTFIALHVANLPEDLAQVGQWLDQYRNMNVEIGARIGELGRQPRTARRFFERYQDRILFGTDATPNAGKEFPQQDLRPEMFRCYFRFLETEDEYFDYAPSAVPPQGRWRIYGIALPDGILGKVYRENAARIFRLA